MGPRRTQAGTDTDPTLARVTPHPHLTSHAPTLPQDKGVGGGRGCGRGACLGRLFTPSYPRPDPRIKTGRGAGGGGAVLQAAQSAVKKWKPGDSFLAFPPRSLHRTRHEEPCCRGDFWGSRVYREEHN